MPKDILLAGDIDNWNVYRKCAVICDVTEHFINHHMLPCRTVDQMRQAARSCKQNVVEGLADATVSFEICFKLLGIARGSLRELREDYKDYLRQHRLPLWDMSDYRVKIWRDFFSSPAGFDIGFTTDKCTAKRPEVVGNVMITLSHQVDAALARVMKEMKEDFERHGGIKEKLSVLRRTWRDRNR